MSGLFLLHESQKISRIEAEYGKILEVIHIFIHSHVDKRRFLGITMRFMWISG
jgi:hypothetical protein